MSAANAESPPADAAGHRASFFRQSGWLMIANVGGGALMYGVHLFAKVIPEQEYALYGALLALTIFCVPQIPLQMVCAQQAAAALASGRARQLAGMFRAAWLAVTGLWLLAAVVMWLVQDRLLAAWGISQPAALWITMLVILVQAWLPMFLGLLQGKQDFLPFGWAMILNGVGRLAFAALVDDHDGATFTYTANDGTSYTARGWIEGWDVAPKGLTMASVGFDLVIPDGVWTAL